MNWTCPYCGRAQTVTNNNHARVTGPFYSKNGVHGSVGVDCGIIVCANDECQEETVRVSLVKYVATSSGGTTMSKAPALIERQLKPEGRAKAVPYFIPQAIGEDYTEACLVRDLSPKASATLSRRCLQGMIRDFCGISKKRLIDEIRELEKQVTEGTADRSISVESVTAIDAVRKIGNIGAHMEADVDHIVPVDPGEAQLLIDLIEGLFDEWYVERHKRAERFSALTALAAKKQEQISAVKSQALLSSPSDDSADTA